MLCIRVLSGENDVSEWVRWIYHAPADLRDLIRMEGVHSGYSIMVILKVPIDVWMQLPECPSASLRAFATTGTLPPKILTQIEDTLGAKLGLADPAELQLHLPASLPSPPPLSPSRRRATPCGSAPRRRAKPLPTGRKLLPSDRSVGPAGKPPTCRG